MVEGRIPPELAGSAEYRWLGDAKNADWGRFRCSAWVAYADWLLGRLTDGLGPRLDESVVVVAADHGELLGEHESWFNHRGIWPGAGPARSEVWLEYVRLVERRLRIGLRRRQVLRAGSPELAVP